MPTARPERRCQAPQPRSGAPKAQGLIGAFWPQHNPPCRRSLLLPQLTADMISTSAAAFDGPSATARIYTRLTDVTGGADLSCTMASCS
jgi:hypothetical protein